MKGFFRVSGQIPGQRKNFSAGHASPLGAGRTDKNFLWSQSGAAFPVKEAVSDFFVVLLKNPVYDRFPVAGNGFFRRL